MRTEQIQLYECRLEKSKEIFSIDLLPVEYIYKRHNERGLINFL